MIKVIGFDLDNTLYDHTQYVKAAYAGIGGFVGRKYNIDEKRYTEWILERWYEKGSSYDKIFEDSYRRFKLDNFSEDIRQILVIYHHARPKLTAYEGTSEVLEYLSGKYRLVLITDGWEETQMYKIQQLKLDKMFKSIYISQAYGRDFYKPSTKIFELCLSNEGIRPHNMLYVGDNPVLDFEPCNKLGIKFIRLMKGEYRKLESDNIFSIHDIRQLPEIIEQWGGEADEKSSGGNGNTF